MPSPASPPVHERYEPSAEIGRDGSPCWPVSGLTELPSSPSQARVQNAQWLLMKAECFFRLFIEKGIRPFTVAGAAQVRTLGATERGLTRSAGLDFLLLPVELRRVNHTASTNETDSTLPVQPNPTIIFAMSNQTQIDQITERVERLLLRYEELQRTNALLTEQVSVLTHERDSLQSRLSAARARVDALLERLPESTLHSGKPSVGSQ